MHIFVGQSVAQMFNAFYVEYVANDFTNKLMLDCWSKDGVDTIAAPIPPYCFIRGTDSEGFVDAEKYEPVRRRSFTFPRDVGEYANHNKVWEGDVRYERVCFKDMKWQIPSDMPRKIFDIECYDKGGAPNKREDPIISMGFSNGEFLHGDELDILRGFYEEMKYVGIGAGWGSGEYYDGRGFDIPYIAYRWDSIPSLVEEFGEFNSAFRHCKFYDIATIYDSERAKIAIKAGEAPASLHLADVAEFENVSQKIDIRKAYGKSKVCELTPEQLKEYNMHDVMATKDIADKWHFLEQRIELARVAHLPLVIWDKKKTAKKPKQDQLRPMILTDQIVLRYARDMGMVLPNHRYDRGAEIIDFRGAACIDPTPDLYKGVQNIDVHSMYTSILRHEKISIDPDGRLIPTAVNDILNLKDYYDAVWKESGKKDITAFLLRTVYKITANYFWGSFGTTSCRWYDPEKAARVTAKGRGLLEEMREYAELGNYRVVYGDTDSIFIMMPKEKTRLLVKMLNRHIAPYEVEAGEYYEVIAWSGEGKRGTKKHYFGLDDRGKIHFAGMDRIKRDASEVARMAQDFFTEQVLFGQSLEKIDRCKMNLYGAIMRGDYDRYLAIRKNVKDLSEYKQKKRKDGTASKLPIHVRAYKKLMEMGHEGRFDVMYVYADNEDGVIPVLPDMDLPEDIDRQKHWDKIIEPAIERVTFLLRPDKKPFKMFSGRKRKVAYARGQTKLG